MTEPLITYELYDNFLNVSGKLDPFWEPKKRLKTLKNSTSSQSVFYHPFSEISDPEERIRCLAIMVDLLPKPNKIVLDRLMYHLARIAYQEPVSRMSASNLAVIFAPCILRRDQMVHDQEQLMDVQKQAVCVQTLIEDKLKQYRSTLTQTVELEHASEKVAFFKKNMAFFVKIQRFFLPESSILSAKIPAFFTQISSFFISFFPTLFHSYIFLFQVSENLRKIEEHKRSWSALEGASGSTQVTPQPDRKISAPPTVSLPGGRSSSTSPVNIETAGQLFVEQLDFLGKEK